MNAERRKAIGLLYEQIERAKSMLENLDLESIKDEEQESFDNMPESLQQGEPTMPTAPKRKEDVA